MLTPRAKIDVPRKDEVETSTTTGTEDGYDASYMPSKSTTTAEQHHLPASNAIANASTKAHPTTPTKHAYLPSNESTATTITDVDDGAPSHVPATSVEVNVSPRLRNLHELSRMEHKFDEGCDSDGEIGPFCNLEDIEGPQIFDEEPLSEES